MEALLSRVKCFLHSVGAFTSHRVSIAALQFLVVNPSPSRRDLLVTF